MKGCMLLQGNYAKVGHAIALQLKENFGVHEFCAYVISPRAKAYMEAQQELRYTSFLFDEAIHEKYTKEIIDLDYVKSMEEKYGDSNFWRYVYTDRRIMMSHDSLDQGSMILHPLYSHEDILKILQVRLRHTIEFLEKERPDFIVFFAIGTIGTMLLYHLAKKMGIRVLAIDTARIGNKMTFTEDFNTFDGLKEIFTEIQSGKLVSSHRGEATNILQSFKTSRSLGLGYTIDVLKPPPLTWKKRLNTYRTIWQTHANYDHAKQYAAPAGLGRVLETKLVDRWRRLVGYKDFYTAPRWDEDFAFFPLHFEPETSLLNIAPFYSDQVMVIGLIARSLPAHFKLYVKEHPAMVNKRSRKYYETLLKIPNVILLDPAIKSFTVIEHTKLILTITGTVGWEGILLGKPVISFGNTFYNEFPAVARCRVPEELPDLVRRQMVTF
ncbi:MAG: hypothetical protein AAB408_00975, partial [Patescibacteria group bacterium]